MRDELPIRSPMRSVLGTVRGAYSVVSSGARHALWYVRYQMDGNGRARRQPPRPRRSSDRG